AIASERETGGVLQRPDLPKGCEFCAATEATEVDCSLRGPGRRCPVRAHPARGPAVSTGDRGSNTRARGTTATEAPRKVSAALAVSECGNPIREAARPPFTDLDRLYHRPPGGSGGATAQFLGTIGRHGSP